MDFLIFLFGAIYVGICLFNESVINEDHRRKWEKYEKDMEQYKLGATEWHDVTNLVTSNRAWCIERCKKYILPFAPDLDVSYDRLKTIMFAMNGHYGEMYSPFADTRFLGDPADIPNKVEFWHQVENALHDAGKTNAKFYWTPPFDKDKKVVIDKSDKPQLPVPRSSIRFGEAVNIFPSCKRMW